MYGQRYRVGSDARMVGGAFIVLAFVLAVLAPATAFATHTGDVTALANGERPCSDCHLGDLAPEHSKATSGGGCMTCHNRAHDLRAEMMGNYSHTCSDPVCHAEGGNASPVHKDYCLACHDISQPNFATNKTSFNAVDPVDRDSVCASCHVPGLVGTHPYHQSGANCGAACHPGWGSSLLERTPTYSDPVSGASFADSASKATPVELLHAIHGTPRWPAGVSSSKSACASCHATAACTVCHEGVTANHAQHSASDQVANPAWTGLVAHGIVGGDQTQRTAFVDSIQCASVGCHDLATTASSSASLIEDYNYGVGGNPDDPTGTNSAIAVNVPWRYRASNRYTGGRMSYTNTAGLWMTATFTGSRVELISDRDPYRGTAWVWIDDQFLGTVDAYSATTRTQTVVFSAETTPGVEHTIAVYPSGEKGASARGAFFVVDAFRVYPSLAQTKLPNCRDCHAERVATHW